MAEKSQMPNPSSFPQEHQINKNIYRISNLSPNIIPKICSELSSTEILDDNVEKYLVEMADNFIDTAFESACYLAKQRNSDKVEAADFASAIFDNFGIYEPSAYTSTINQMNINNLKSQSTSDHQKRLELTKEETKNVNI